MCRKTSRLGRSHDSVLTATSPDCCGSVPDTDSRRYRSSGDVNDERMIHSPCDDGDDESFSSDTDISVADSDCDENAQGSSVDSGRSATMTDQRPRRTAAVQLREMMEQAAGSSSTKDDRYSRLATSSDGMTESHSRSSSPDEKKETSCVNCCNQSKFKI